MEARESLLTVPVFKDFQAHHALLHLPTSMARCRQGCKDVRVAVRSHGIFDDACTRATGVDSTRAGRVASTRAPPSEGALLIPRMI